MLVVTALARQAQGAWQYGDCALVHAFARGGESGGG
jgi:hypothetical protein